ncbi:hypothetical protein [Mangrovimonas futianensis]|uniref:hypothetical protein n=1 Tax=Mangrovimonas futianensis TaxID=2895523 RepID=UPI001E3FA948|nr:hypothetical protein [Mangrovimonas futianensis]MCF1420838.1 hypothetical protein [Mangrovimonas futianensis]
MQSNFRTSSQEEIRKTFVEFQFLFSRFQRNLKEDTKYIDYQAYKDIKLIFYLYAKIYHYKGYKSYNIKLPRLKLLTSQFNCYQNLELYNYLRKRLIHEGNKEKADELSGYINFLKLQCSWKTLIKKFSIYNLFQFIHRLCSYNILSLFSSLVIYVLFLTLLSATAKIEIFEVLIVHKIQISPNTLLNNVLNTLTYIFDFDEKMEIKPMNALGVLILVFNKIILAILIINFLVKEILDRVKFS